MNRKQIVLFLLVFGAGLQGYSQSYISRLWNTKKYAEIVDYSAKGQSLSGQDNVYVGRAFMALDPPQPLRALEHYDLAGKKCSLTSCRSVGRFLLCGETHWEENILGSEGNIETVLLKTRPDPQGSWFLEITSIP